ncbi:MAG TPA: carbohydrate-binding family 9-like protein [Polyangia bacterium]|nr:carbohydrate-binding family 9-like protein [Polyangia bacterium]
MRSLALAACALALAACKKPDPLWAAAPARNLGEPTIAGEPLAIPRFAARPVLDGKLDDAVWANAATIGPLVNPFDGRDAGASPVAAFARAGWDDAALYLAVIVRDRAPASPFQRDDADPHVWGASSGVELMLQPGDPGDNRDYYELQVDVAGAVFDSHFDDYNAPITGTGTAKIFGHQDWSSKVERAIFVERGSFYSVELALPWSSLAAATSGRVAIPPRAGDVWRANLYAFRDGQRQALAWSPLRGQGNFHKTSRFGRLRFQ